MRTPSFARSLVLAFAVVAAFAIPSTARAQVGKITGTATDAESGTPIEGVQVFLQGTGLGTVTNANGRYFLINVPPGTYTVVARRLGYQEQRFTNVSVLIDVTREVNLRLRSSSATLAAVQVTEQQTPLITPGMTGSSDAISSSELTNLPVNDIRSALALQAGFLAAPDNTDILSYTDVRRALTPVHIRGGRSTETLTMIDGIPVNNFLFGGPALDISTDAVQQIDYVRGGFEPQYGNALSGIINIAVKEGTTDLRGSVEARSSGAGGLVGSDYDELRNFLQVQGFVSGSVPATADRLRYLVAGRQRSGAQRVLEFDDQVYNPRADERDVNQNFQSVYDLFPGFRAFGFDNQRDVIAKASFYFTPQSKVNVTVIDYDRQTLPFAFDWQQTGFDSFAQCVRLYPDLVENCSAIYNDGRTINTIDDLQDTENENWYVRQASTRQTRQLYVGQVRHTQGRLGFSGAVGQFTQARETCTFASAICQGRRLGYTYINGPFVYTGGRSRNDQVPLFGTEEIAGGDEIETRVARADVTWQATDHHNLQGGVFTQQHEVAFSEWRDVGLNRAVLQESQFSAKPWDAAVYFQDRIEYDFLTIKLGARFDYGRAPGRGWANPQDPTNGTTAREVCEDPQRFGLPANRFTFVNDQGTPDPSDDVTLDGLASCSALGRDTVMLFARDIAAGDDFREAPSRSSFSPRIGVSFPLTERSTLFFNFGRFAQNPSMYDLYRGTGIGVRNAEGELIEGTPAAINIQQQSGRQALIGNPQLATEIANSFEIGYAVEFRRNYSVRVTAFNKDQTGLAGIAPGGIRPDGSRVADVGATYSNQQQPSYRVLVNTDYQTARGVELQIRRRLSNFWAFDVNYSLSRVVTNADPPELEAQKLEEGLPAVTQIRASVDQPHVFNAILRYQADAQAPPIRWVGRYLRHSAATMTLRTASGLPYTPINDFAGTSPQERNSGTGPATLFIDLYGSKDWPVGNVRVGTFVNVTNLLNRRNCITVYGTTGQCESGGFALGRLEKRRIGAGLGTTGTFSQAFDRPDYLYPPRAISGGLRLTF